jgi:hypothetical protein
METMEDDEPLSSSEAQRAPCTGLGARPVDTSSRPRNTLQTDILYTRPDTDRGTCDSAAVRRGAGDQRTCLCVRRAAGMLRACYRHAANPLTVHPRVQMLILTSVLQTGETNLVVHVFTCEQMSGTNPETAAVNLGPRLHELQRREQKHGCSPRRRQRDGVGDHEEDGAGPVEVRELHLGMERARRCARLAGTRAQRSAGVLPARRLRSGAGAPRRRC